MVRTIKSIHCPTNTGQQYYSSHYVFFKSLVKAADVRIIHRRMPATMSNAFYIRLVDRVAVVDFSDHLSINQVEARHVLYFKYHYSLRCHRELENVFPLTPISFYDWDRFHVLARDITYHAGGDVIMHNQRLSEGAVAERRGLVRSILLARYGGNVDCEISHQETFWRKLSTSLVAVCVPGARTNILDRGQFQLMAFGGCTISPRLEIWLPYMNKPLPNEHYIECAPDYSDLVERIEWCRDHRRECRLIGGNAAALFSKTSMPNAIWSWIKQCADGSARDRIVFSDRVVT